MEKILRIENIEKYYGNKTNITKAVEILLRLLIIFVLTLMMVNL